MKIIGCVLMIANMLLFPEQTTQAAQAALRVWALDVTPSLFPYMIFCRMLALQIKNSRIPPAWVASFLGILGGSPSGAAVVSSYAENGKVHDLLSLCALTGTISPMFIMNTVGTWLNSAQTGRLLLLVHLCSATLSMLLVRLFAQPAGFQPVQTAENAMQASSPLTQSIQAILQVGGCIVFYSVIAAGIQLVLPAGSIGGAFLHGIFEVTGGMHALSASPLQPYPQAILCAALSGWSGLSILSQNQLFVRPFGVQLKHLMGLGMLRGCVSAVLMALAFPLLIHA